MRRVDLQVDRLPIDAFVVTSNPSSFRLNLPLDLLEIKKSPTHHMVEFRPFLLSSNTCWGMWDMDLARAGLVVPFAWDVYELQYQGSPCDDAATAREKVSSNNVFENR